MKCPKSLHIIGFYGGTFNIEGPPILMHVVGYVLGWGEVLPPKEGPPTILVHSVKCVLDCGEALPIVSSSIKGPPITLEVVEY